MRLRRFYQLTILFPLLGLGLVAALDRGNADLLTGLAEGGRAHWIYPRSATRGLLAYGVVAGWLLMQLRRRRPGDSDRCCGALRCSTWQP